MNNVLNAIYIRFHLMLILWPYIFLIHFFLYLTDPKGGTNLNYLSTNVYVYSINVHIYFNSIFRCFSQLHF